MRLQAEFTRLGSRITYLTHVLARLQGLTTHPPPAPPPQPPRILALTSVVILVTVKFIETCESLSLDGALVLHDRVQGRSYITQFNKPNRSTFIPITGMEADSVEGGKKTVAPSGAVPRAAAVALARLLMLGQLKAQNMLGVVATAMLCGDSKV